MFPTIKRMQESRMYGNTWRKTDIRYCGPKRPIIITAATFFFLFLAKSFCYTDVTMDNRR
jgi:hypothetical protein